MRSPIHIKRSQSAVEDSPQQAAGNLPNVRKLNLFARLIPLQAAGSALAPHFQGRPAAFLKSLPGTEGRSLPYLLILIFAVSLSTVYLLPDIHRGHIVGQAEGRSNEEAAQIQSPLAQTISEKTAREIIAEAYFELRAGNFDKGISILRSALKDSPGSGELKSALAEGLNAAAVNAYSNGDYRVAKDLLNEATGLSGASNYL